LERRYNEAAVTVPGDFAVRIEIYENLPKTLSQGEISNLDLPNTTGSANHSTSIRGMTNIDSKHTHAHRF
jgi:hypothetical protein